VLIFLVKGVGVGVDRVDDRAVICRLRKTQRASSFPVGGGAGELFLLVVVLLLLLLLVYHPALEERKNPLSGICSARLLEERGSEGDGVEGREQQGIGISHPLH
jgi:hypothetical protein